MATATKPRYTARTGSWFSDADASIIGGELERIEKEHGNVTAEHLVKEAAGKDNPTHGFFDWNDKKAAHQQRLRRARQLIRGVVVIVDKPNGTSGEVPAYTNLTVEPVGEGKQREYVPQAEVLNDDQLRQQAIKKLVTDVYGRRDEAAQYEELAELVQAMDTAARAFGVG